MAADDLPSLRERKKLRTREVIRSQALQLFEKHGYANTTIVMIAEAADVSPRTFSRYFDSKASLLIPDQLMDPIIAAFVAAPTDLTPVAAYRYALTQAFSAMAGDEWEPERSRQQLLYTLPEAQGALYSEYIHTIELIAEAIGMRLDRPADDVDVRTTAGAITGVLMNTLHGIPMDPKAIYRALDFLDAGLPLTERI